MPWWGTLLIVAGVQTVFLIILWVLIKRQQASGQELVAAERSKVQRLEEEVKAEKDAREKVTAELQRFADETKKVQAWYNDQKDRIMQEAKDAFQNLAADPSELDRRLAALLGTTKSDTDPTPTKPGG